MGKVKGTYDYVTNGAGYAADKAGYGIFTVLKIILFIPAQVLGFLSRYFPLTGFLVFFISMLVSMKKLIYKDDSFMEMFSRARSNPNGFFNGNTQYVVLVGVCMVIISLLIIIPLGRGLMKLYTKVSDKAAISDLSAQKRKAAQVGYKAQMKYGSMEKREENAAQSFRDKLGD